MFWFTAEHLNSIGIAVEQEPDEFIECIDCSVGLCVDDLFEVGKAE